VIISISAAVIAILSAPLTIVFEFLEYNIMTDMEIALELMTDDEKQLLVQYVLEYIRKRIIEQKVNKKQSAICESSSEKAISGR
jgi:hypothetical protein